MAVSKIAKNSFPGILSAGKVLGIAMLLLLGNPSEGKGLPDNSFFLSEAVSTPTSCSFQWQENPNFGVFRNNIPERISFSFFQQRKYSLKPAEK